MKYRPEIDGLRALAVLPVIFFHAGLLIDTIFFETFAIFNILLAFVNLLPMPGLDGGNILFIIYEKIAKKELSILWQELIIKCSFIFLAIITIHATMNDILRIID